MNSKQRPLGNVLPGHGGCWFCYHADGDDLVFDTEFDTFVHLSCIKDALNKDANHREADLMRYLLEE